VSTRSDIASTGGTVVDFHYRTLTNALSAQCLTPKVSSFTFYLPSSILTYSYTFLVDDTLEFHVHSPAFDKECAMYSRGIGKAPLSDTDYYSSDHSDLWEKDSSSFSSIESSRYDVPKLEAHLYYCHWTRRLGTFCRCRYRSSQLYEGYLVVKLDEKMFSQNLRECARLRRMQIRLAKSPVVFGTLSSSLTHRLYVKDLFSNPPGQMLLFDSTTNGFTIS